MREGTLHEREREHGLLEQLVHDLAGGRPGALAFEGVAGIGKTRLARTAADLARASGIAVHAEPGLELEQTLGFGLIERLTAIEPSALIERAFANRLLAASTPTLLVVDDAHWVDGPSQRALAQLVARWDGAPLGLVLTTRPTTERPELTRLLAAPGVRVRRLRPFTLDGTARLLADRAGRRIAPDRIHALHAATGGVPFYVGALADDLPTDGALTPPAVRHALTLRLTALGPDASATARAAAVLEEPTQLPRLATLAQLDPHAAAEAVHALLTEGLFVAEPNGYRLAHAILAGAALADLSTSERGHLHATAARILRSDGAPSAAVAKHLARTPPANDPDAFADLRTTGADNAARGAVAEARALLERALAEPPPPDRRDETVLALARSQLATGDVTALDTLRTLTRSPETAPEVAAGAATELIVALAQAGRDDEAIAAVRSLRERRLPPPVAREVTLAAALGALLQGALATGWAAFDELRDDPERSAVADALIALYDLWAGGSPEAAHTRALDALARMGVSMIEHAAWASVLQVLVLVGRYDDAARTIAHVQRRIAAGGAAGLAPTIALNAAFLAHHCGHVRDREEHGAHAREQARASGQVAFGAAGSAMVAFSALDRGDLDAAEAALAEPEVDDAAGQGLHSFALQARGLLALRRERPHEALDLFLQAGRDQRRYGVLAPANMDWRSDAALAAHAAGVTARARALADEELQLAQDQGLRRATGIALRKRARITGSTADAEQAVASLGGTGAELELARAYLTLGELISDKRRAREPLRVALEAAAGLGAHADARRARAALISTGARPRVAIGESALSARERRIAELAVQGRSNAEIALEENVAIKTVEGQLTIAYRKLGIRRRSELEAALHEGASRAPETRRL